VPDSEGLIPLLVLCPELRLAMLPNGAFFLSGEVLVDAEAEIPAECLGLIGSSISVSDMSAASIPTAPPCEASSSASLRNRLQ